MGGLADVIESELAMAMAMAMAMVVVVVVVVVAKYLLRPGVGAPALP